MKKLPVHCIDKQRIMKFVVLHSLQNSELIFPVRYRNLKDEQFEARVTVYVQELPFHPPRCVCICVPGIIRQGMRRSHLVGISYSHP